MKLEKPNGKTALVLLKIIRVIMIIGLVCMYIGSVSLVVAGLVLPSIGTQVKNENGVLTLFGNEITYEANEDNDIVFKYEDQEYVLSEEKLELDFAEFNGEKIVSLLSEVNIGKIIVVIELYIIAGLVTIVFSILETRILVKVFENTINEETPFVDVNPSLLMKIVTLLIYEFVAMIILYYIAGMTSKGYCNIDVNANQLMEAAMFYIIAWAIDKGNAKTSVKTVKVETEKKTKKSTKKK